jgi:hypothetical protein
MIGCAGHVTCMEKMTEAKMFIGKPEAKRSRRRRRHRLEDNV